MKLLVVEDDRRIASFLERGLAAEGYQVSVENDGRDGLERARQDPGEVAPDGWLLGDDERLAH